MWFARVKFCSVPGGFGSSECYSAAWWYSNGAKLSIGVARRARTEPERICSNQDCLDQKAFFTGDGMTGFPRRSQTTGVDDLVFRDLACLIPKMDQQTPWWRHILFNYSTRLVFSLKYGAFYLRSGPGCQEQEWLAPEWRLWTCFDRWHAAG